MQCQYYSESKATVSGTTGSLRRANKDFWGAFRSVSASVPLDKRKPGTEAIIDLDNSLAISYFGVFYNKGTKARQ